MKIHIKWLNKDEESIFIEQNIYLGSLVVWILDSRLINALIINVLIANYRIKWDEFSFIDIKIDMFYKVSCNWFGIQDLCWLEHIKIRDNS